MSTKFPLAVILMEIAVVCHRKGIELHLYWLPREQNIEADALSNQDCHLFKPENEIKVDNLKFWCMDELIAEGEKLYLTIEDLKKRQAKMATAKEPNNSKDTPRKAKRLKATRLKTTNPW